MAVIYNLSACIVFEFMVCVWVQKIVKVLTLNKSYRHKVQSLEWVASAEGIDATGLHSAETGYVPWPELKIPSRPPRVPRPPPMTYRGR